MFKNYKRIINENINSKKIAIIFSSKKILAKNYGKKIDNYNNVIRFNDSIIKNYEKFVGSKTKLRFANTTILFNRLERIKKKFIKENIIFISDHYIPKLKKKNIKKKFKQKIYFFDNKYFYFYLTLIFLTKKIFHRICKCFDSIKFRF